MNDNVIQLGSKRKKPEAPDVGRGLLKPEGFIAMDQDPTFNHRLENYTTHHVVKLNECKTSEDVDALVRATAELWHDSLTKSPEHLDLLSIEAYVDFPGDDNKPTAALFNFDHRVRVAIATAFEKYGDVETRDKVLSTMSSFSMTVRMWMFSNIAGNASSQLGYGGKMGVQLDFSYYGMGITLLIDNAIQANTFFARKIVPA